MIEQIFREMSSFNISIIVLGFIIYFFIKVLRNMSESTDWENKITKFWVGTKEIGILTDKEKIVKIIPSSSFYTAKNKNFKVFSVANRNLAIRKYKFRTSDYNSVSLEINLELKVEETKKAYLSTLGYNYYAHNFEIDTLIINKLVEEIRNIVFSYKRKELFDKYKSISEIIKTKLSSQIIKLGFEIIDVTIFEIR